MDKYKNHALCGGGVLPRYCSVPLMEPLDQSAVNNSDRVVPYERRLGKRDFLTVIIRDVYPVLTAIDVASNDVIELESLMPCRTFVCRWSTHIDERRESYQQNTRWEWIQLFNLCVLTESGHWWTQILQRLLCWQVIVHWWQYLLWNDRWIKLQ